MNNLENQPIHTLLSENVQAISQRCLQEEIAHLSGRLDGFLKQRFPEADETILMAQGFLQSQSRKYEFARSDLIERIRLYPQAAINRLCERFELSEVEVSLVILCGLAEYHEGFADIFRVLHPVNQPYATVALASHLFQEATDPREAFYEQIQSSALFRFKFLNIEGDGPLNSCSIVLKPEYWRLLNGQPVDSGFDIPDRFPLPGMEAWLKSEAVKHALACMDSDLPCTVMVFNHNLETAIHRGLALIRGGNRRALLFDCRQVKRSGSDIDMSSATGFYWACLLTEAIPVFIISDKNDHQCLKDFFHYHAPLVICGIPGSFPELPERLSINLPVEKMTTEQLTQVWREVLPELESNADTLAAIYPVEPFYARIMADSAKALAKRHQTPLSMDMLETLFRNSKGANLPDCVSLVPAKLGWLQLVLPDSIEQQLREATQRLLAQQKVVDDWKFLYNRRGARGVRILFSGPPGTGKTLSAEVLANTLKTDLLVVDISRVVSKWVGETEKNLARVFNHAEQMRAVLFFDEADAIFGKRTEVSDAHDRYANLETAYLLARLETYDGMAILATNYRNNIDAAFIRRLDFIVEFREPSASEREKLWRCHVPEQAPLGKDVNFTSLANQFPMVGGEIRNAAVRAAYLAVAEKQSEDELETHSSALIHIHQKHFIEAIRREYEKTGKPFREVKTP